MNREILFRGKSLYTGEWVYGYLVDKIYGSKPVIIREAYMEDNCSIGWEYEHVNPDTVGQFTGLTDKNGKRIFEGDILLVKTTRDSINEKTRNDEYITKGVVVFNEGHFELEGKGLVLCTYWGLKSLFAAARFKEYEVIGNIYDNPELLEV